MELRTTYKVPPRKFKALTYLFALLLLLFPASPAPAFDGSEITNVVDVAARCSGAYYHVSGHPKETFVITAAHCANLSADGQPQLWIPVTIYDGSQPIPGKVIIYDEWSDSVVIAVHLDTVRSVPLLVARHFPVMEEPIHYSGNTLHMSKLVFQGRICGHPSSDTWLINGFVWFGLSGSSLYNEQGETIGVISALPEGAPGLPIFSIMIFHTLPADLSKQIHHHLRDMK